MLKYFYATLLYIFLCAIPAIGLTATIVYFATITASVNYLMLHSNAS